MSLSDQLLALHDLHVRGFLSDAEFSLAKARAIETADRRGAKPATPPPAVPPALAPVPGPPPMPPPLNPVVPGVGLALGAASIANGGLTG